MAESRGYDPDLPLRADTLDDFNLSLRYAALARDHFEPIASRLFAREILSACTPEPVFEKLVNIRADNGATLSTIIDADGDANLRIVGQDGFAAGVEFCTRRGGGANLEVTKAARALIAAVQRAARTPALDTTAADVLFGRFDG